MDTIVAPDIAQSVAGDRRVRRTGRRLNRRFGTRTAPAIGLVVFAVSASVVGPQISGESGSPASVVQQDDHS